jgi:Bacterial transcriptional activator domain
VARGTARRTGHPPWLNEVREALLAERFALELDYTDLLLRDGEHAGLVGGLTARAAAHPVDERVAGQLMLALYRSGRQAEALDHYTTLRSRLATTLGVDPGPTLRELHQRILTADPDLGAPQATVAVTGAVPRQLPAPPRSFVGRVRELVDLDKAVDTQPGIMVISAIGGSGGIGKTWLALHWAHQNTDRFPDGQLYLDLHGFDPAGPTSPHAALSSLLDAFAVPPRSMPADLAARAGLFRSLVAGRRMLVR